MNLTILNNAACRNRNRWVGAVTKGRHPLGDRWPQNDELSPTKVRQKIIKPYFKL